MFVWYSYLHNILIAGLIGPQGCLGIEVQIQPFANVVQCHPVTGPLLLHLETGITNHQVQLIALCKYGYADPPPLRYRFNPVIHGIFQQGLQDQGRHHRIHGRILALPVHGQAISKPNRLDFSIRSGQFEFLDQGYQCPRFCHQGTKKFCQIFQNRFRPGRLAAHQAEHRIQAVEQKMWADTGLQRHQTGFGQGRRKHPVAPVEVPKDNERD